MRSFLNVIVFIAFGFLVISDQVNASPEQEVISYDNLLAGKVQKTFTWRNGNGLQESIEINIINIPETLEVQNLKKEYLINIYGDNYQDNLQQVTPTMIVVHSMALGHLQNSLEESGFLLNTVNWGISKWGQLPVGSHFMVDQDGTIYCLSWPSQGKTNSDDNIIFPLKRHVKEANPFAIGIENIVPFVSNWWEKNDSKKTEIFSNLSQEQIVANAKLVSWLKSWNEGITHVFSHSQFVDSDFRSSLLNNEELLPVPFNLEYVTKNKYDIKEDILDEIIEAVNVRGYILSSTL